MLSQAEAVIYLSNLRGCTQKEWFRSYHTLNFGSYRHENRNPVGKLRALNDDTLKPGSTLTHRLDESTGVLLLPLIGGLHYKSGLVITGSLDVGEAHVLLLPPASTVEITNPYNSELINFLELWFTIDSASAESGVVGKYEFDLLTAKNTLVKLQTRDGMELPGSRILIGNYGGRKEGTYPLQDPAKGVFAFVIEGAFEVQNRLLQARDGLSISNTNEIEFEALSEEGILLLIEED